MELEHEIMKNIIRLASGGRRRSGERRRSDGHRFHGYGRILDLLSRSDGLSLSQIAEELGIRPQSASEAISSMESQLLVEKRASELDRRCCLIYITPAGRQRQIDLRNERVENARRVFSHLTEEEKLTLLQLLNKAAAGLQENKEEC